MYDQDDAKHERIVDINNAIKDPTKTLYRKTENAALMAEL